MKDTVIEKDQELAVINAMAYKKPKKVSQRVVEYDNGKKMIHRCKEFENGVVKNDIVGMIKDSKVIFNRGIDFDKL